MAKFYQSISDDLQVFIRAQKMFFVGSAPSEDGHVNISPKGMDSLRILAPNQVAYLDLTGSGNETSAHIQQNGRVTIMFCAFDGAPNIVRLYGDGEVILPDTPDWDRLSPHFTLYVGARQIIVINVTLVQTSCGFAVPLYDFVDQRETLVKWAETKGEDGLEHYQSTKNFNSIDGLPTPLKIAAQPASDDSGKR